MLRVESAPPVVTLAELKAHLRIEDEGEDALLAGWLRAATEIVEQELGQLLIRREVTEQLLCGDRGIRLSLLPVVRIESVEVQDSEGVWQLLEAGAIRADITADGSAWLVPEQIGSGQLFRVRYQAGIALVANDLPEFLRQAVIRIAAHWHAFRDSAEARHLPQAVRQMLGMMRLPRFRAVGA